MQTKFNNLIIKRWKKVNETTVMKMQAVEEARQNLMRAKSVLEANKDAEANIKKSAQVNVGKAETAYFEALKKGGTSSH